MRFSIAALLLLTACPTTVPHEDDEACEHLQEGPAVPITALGASESGEAPLIDDDHRRYDIVLPGAATSRSGRVRFAATAAGDLRVFLDRAVPLTVTDATGTEVVFEHSEPSSEACAEIQAIHLLPLEVGTYQFVFGPTTEVEVGVVLESVSHEEH